MATTMHRLQISLPHWQADFLADRARREGTSIAELVRRLVAQEAEASEPEDPVESIMEIAGIGEEIRPRIDDLPVSRNVDLYLAEANAPAKSSETRS